MTAADDAVDVTRRLLSPVHALLAGTTGSRAAVRRPRRPPQFVTPPSPTGGGGPLLALTWGEC